VDIIKSFNDVTSDYIHKPPTKGIKLCNPFPSILPFSVCHGPTEMSRWYQEHRNAFGLEELEPRLGTQYFNPQ
jgi:hypothetical protein